MFGSVLSYTPEMGLQYVVSVEEWHLSVRFYPNLQSYSMRFGLQMGAKIEYKKRDPTHLVLGILCKMVKGRYVKFEFPALAELAETSPERDEIRSGHRDAETHRGLGDVENSIFVEAKTVGAIWSVDEFNEISPLHALVLDRRRQSESNTHDVVCELLENRPALFLSQWSHLERCGGGGRERERERRRKRVKGNRGSRDPWSYVFAVSGSRSRQISSQN